ATRVARRDRGHVHAQQPFACAPCLLACALGYAIRPAEYVLHLGPVHDHAHHDIAGGRDLRGSGLRGRFVRAGPRLGLALRVRPHRQLVAGPGHIGGHARAHDPQAQKADSLSHAPGSCASGCPARAPQLVGGPYPPPPGVSMRSRSPGRSLPVTFAGSPRGGSPGTIRLSRPGAPGRPPCAPRGAWRRRSPISEKLISARASISRTTPSPPLCSPSPPDPRRSAYSLTRSGNSRSSASIGVFSVLLIATCTALGPSVSAQAPWPPPSVS